MYLIKSSTVPSSTRIVPVLVHIKYYFLLIVAELVADLQIPLKKASTNSIKYILKTKYLKEKKQSRFSRYNLRIEVNILNYMRDLSYY